MKASPRVARFARVWTDAELDAAVERRAVELSLMRGTPLAEAEQFANAAKAVFLSDSQVRRILRVFIDLARAHAEMHFSTDGQYKKHLYERFPWGLEHPSAICFTGLDGIGKSQLLAALATLLKDDTLIDMKGYSNLPLVALWLLTLRDGAGLNTILQPMLEAPATRENEEARTESTEATKRKPVTDGSLPELLRVCRVITWRDAVCLLLIDEFQNLSKGGASAKATAVLLQLRTIGPRLAFCANFSLVHKLMDGNPEDGRRLVSQPIEMLPDRSGSKSFCEYLIELKRIAPKVFVFDVEKLNSVIHQYTFGVKGNVVSLLKWAYVVSRSRSKSGTVGEDEIREAYLSSEYSFTRKCVENLWKQAARDECLDRKLWSPFRQPGSSFWAEDEERPISKREDVAKVVDATRAIEEFERRTDDALIDAAMTKADAAAHRAMTPITDLAGTSAKVIRLTRRKTSKQDLLDGADALDRL